MKMKYKKINKPLSAIVAIMTVLLCTATIQAADYFTTDGGVSVIPVFANTGAADTAMGTPVRGALIYSTSDGGIMYYDGSSWVSIESVADGTAANNTLRWNGSDWVESTVLTNDGTDVTAGGNVTVTGDLTVTGDDITMTTNTAGALFVGDGTNFNPVVAAGDAAIATDGTVTIAENAVDGTDIAMGSDAQGDILFYDGTDYVRLPAGTSGQMLQTQGSSADPVWANATVDTNLGNDDQTLSGARTVTMSGNSLTLDGTGDIVLADSGNITTAGDVAVNGGDITSTATALNMDVADTGTIALRDGTNNLLTVADAGTIGNVTATGTLTASGGSITSGSDGNDGSLVIYSEQGGTDYSYTINPNAAATQNVTLTLPADDGTADQILQTDGLGNLSWGSASGGIYSGDGTAPSDVDVTVTDNIDFDSGTLFIDGTNNRVGIGTTSPRGILDVRTGAGGNVYLTNDTNTGTTASAFIPGHVYFAPYNGGNNVYLQARRENDSGSLDMILRTSNGGSVNDALKLSAVGDVTVPRVYSNTTGSGANVNVDSAGVLRRSTSSRKIKKDIKYAGVDPKLALQFKPVSFNTKDNKAHLGFIAEDMRGIDERFVNGDPELPGLEMNAIVSALTATIQEQQKQIDKLEARIEKLEKFLENKLGVIQ